MREDAFGLWWEVDPALMHGRDKGPKPQKEKGKRQAREPRVAFDPSRLPDPPETDWQMPTEFPCLENAGIIAVDLETHDPDLTSKGPGVRRDGYILGVAISTDTGFSGYYPVAHNKGTNFEPERVYEWLRRELTRPRQPKIGANILYDLDYLAEVGVWTEGPLLDVQIAEPLIDENARSYKLERLGQKYLKEGKLSDVLNEWGDRYFGKGQTIKNLRHLPASFVGPYAIQDTELTLRVWAQQKLELERQGLNEIFDIECRLLRCLLYMRRQGARVDIVKANALADDLDKQAKEATDFMASQYGGKAEIWSADYLTHAFKKLQIPLQHDDNGSPIFRKGYLEELEHPFCKALTTARKLEKLNGTFIRGHILGNAIGDRIHCQFNQLRSDDSGAVSGRFSSNQPNLQNVPSRDPIFGPLVRGIFIPEDGMVWWRSDYSQVEPRILLHYANKSAENIRAQYVETPDMSCYRMMMKDMPPGIGYDAFKCIYLGLTYNMGVDKLANELGVSKGEAERLYELFHHGAPYIGNLKERVIAKSNKDGELITLLGRKRHFPMWESAKWAISKKEGYCSLEEARKRYGNNIKRAWTYKSLNALIQGSAADVMKKAMVDLWENGLMEAGNCCLTVHDELDGSIDQNSDAIKEIKYTMENAVKLRVPILADMSTGANWGACK